MSEVYIRSQNKEKLYRLGGNYACVEYGEYEDVKKNPFMGRQYQPVPMQYVSWFRHEIRSIYEQLRAAGVPVREMITEQQRVISW